MKHLSSPIPPTPPPKVPASPAYLSYLAKHLPSLSNTPSLDGSSAAPSLDGSLSSDQLAAMSAPATPDTGNDDDETGWGGGIQLEPAAMATLRALSGEEDLYDHQTEQVIEVPPMSSDVEMQQSPPSTVTNIRRNDSVILSAAEQRSFDSLTRLEIPSPGGFFASLAPGARHTWHLVSASPASAHPPSSTTAEHFYKTPWSSVPVERIIEVPETMSDGIPTARPIFSEDPNISTSRPQIPKHDSDETIKGYAICESPQDEDIVATEIIHDYQQGYLQKLHSEAAVNLERTSMWLSAQSDYLSALINPPERRDDEVALLQREASIKDQGQRKKTVRFSEIVTQDVACPSLPKPSSHESAYYRAFQHFYARSRSGDTFVHRLPRFEALQCQRVSFSEAHRNQLLGKYQLSVVPLSAKRRMSANVARGDEIAVEDPEKIRRDREREALGQMSGAVWNVSAFRALNGGRLVAAPFAKKLARLSSLGPTPNGLSREKARILDLGGQASCDWAWHCAVEYPHTKVYTVTTKTIRQLSNCNIRGPQNHQQVAVNRLWKLPFKDNYFDLISARYLYVILKVAAEHGEDEYENCLDECMRCLKPGGYLDFSIMDSDIINAGPLGHAKSVEFGFNLRTRGYDAYPTKTWIKRLQESGFVNIKCGWVFLPMGTPVVPPSPNRDTLGVKIPEPFEEGAIVMGSTDDAAGITGLMGSWAWEKWMLRLECENGKDEGQRLDGIWEVLEEGRKCGAGWRMLKGWARKPTR
jgi:SAM-dependent methyltransferase